MCTVVGCDSWRRNAQYFNLPEFPEIRFQWVQFVASDDEQLYKESMWKGMAICQEHFLEECFEKPLNFNKLRLKPCAVPTVRIKSEEVGGLVDSLQLAADQINKFNKSETFALYKEESVISIEKEKCGPVGVTSCEDRFSIKKPVVNKEEDTEGVKRGSPNQQDGGSCEEDYLCALKKPALTNDTDTEEDILSEDEGSGNVNSDQNGFPIKNPVRTEENIEKDSDKGIVEDTRERPSYVDMPTPVRRSIKQLCNECGYFCQVDRVHICEHKLKPYACNTCGKRCFTKISLKLHCLIHGNSKIHNCKYCFAPFKTKLEKLNHQQTHEDSPYPFRCPACPAKFICFIERRNHMRTHPEPKQHTCEHCGITFTKRHVLFRHMVVHTGDKPYKCSVCERDFNQSGHLKSHMRLHSGERPYKCQHCDKAFNHNISLKSHIEHHHSNKTDACDRNDTQSDSCDDNVGKEQDTEEAEDGEKVTMPKTKKWLTGRPKGRPMLNCGGKSYSKRKKKGNKSQIKKQHSDKESEKELRDSNSAFDIEEEEQKESNKTRNRSSKFKTYIDPDHIADRKGMMERPKHRCLRKGRGKAKL